MALKKLAKDGPSGKNGCPTVYIDDDGSFVVQGDLLSTTSFAELENVLPGESAVRIKAETVLAAVRKYRGTV